jgi:8-oxo-dGTP diphosphatase
MVVDDPARHSRPLTAAGALFFDERGRVLIVEPTYKSSWDIPGGHIETGETPSQACIREVEEELGLVIRPGPLLVVDWAPSTKDGDRLLFVFDGGVLDARRQREITLAVDELASCAFIQPEEIANRLIPRLARRVNAAIRSRLLGETWYLEHGVRLV